MIDLTAIPLSKAAYLKALQLNLITWTDFKTGEIFIQRQFWRMLTPAQKVNVIRHMEGLMNYE
jgi:hypothetical protein